MIVPNYGLKNMIWKKHTLISQVYYPPNWRAGIKKNTFKATLYCQRHTHTHRRHLYSTKDAENAVHTFGCVHLFLFYCKIIHVWGLKKKKKVRIHCTHTYTYSTFYDFDIKFSTRRVTKKVVDTKGQQSLFYSYARTHVPIFCFCFNVPDIPVWMTLVKVSRQASHTHA